MGELAGEKILVTGPAGQIAFPLAERLARDNDVWGIARFSDASSRERCEKAGITTRAVDLADPNWGGLPDDFTILLHLAAVIVPGLDFDASPDPWPRSLDRCSWLFGGFWLGVLCEA